MTRLISGGLILGLAGFVGGVVVFWAYPVSFYNDYFAVNDCPDPVPFRYIEIDQNAGDVKLAGDIDGDGLPDLVLGGKPDENLNWYRNPDWKKTVIATPAEEFTTDGALGDVDGDGDLDIVVPDGSQGENLLWFENPVPAGDPTDGSKWQRRVIGAIGGIGKDVKLADFDRDGHLDIATRKRESAMIFFQTPPDSWAGMEFAAVEMGHEGMASGDIDRDGAVDLVLCGMWLRNPGKAAARTQSAWGRHEIGWVPRNFKALVADVNGDARMDVLFSSSENTDAVTWWSYDDEPTGSWTRHTVLYGLEKCHTLQAADMDRDGDMDLVLAQMHTSRSRRILILENLRGNGTRWARHFVATGGLHNGLVVDIDNDGDCDIFGANWTGNPPVKLWINESEPSATGRWSYKMITGSAARTFGLAFADLDGDGAKEILAGPYWYQDPGGDLLGEWGRHSFPAGMHAILAIDVDGDPLPDVIAQKDEGDVALYWLEAAAKGGEQWTSTRIGTVPRASHALGAQGYRVGQMDWDGRPEILVSSGKGIFYFHIPDNPSAGGWPRAQVSAKPSDEGFAVGDIDRDGRMDIAATTGDSKRVEWYQNPGDGTEAWIPRLVGTFTEADYPDRLEIADLNGDRRLDVIVTEENGSGQDAQTFWWEQPSMWMKGEWIRHLVVSQGSTNSMDVADLGGDGDIDLVLGEHRGSKKLALWINDGTGHFGEQVISEGRESHLGARTVDLDGDGDLDIVSLAWDDYLQIHLWRNDADPRGRTNTDWHGPPRAPASGSPCWSVSVRVRPRGPFTETITNAN